MASEGPNSPSTVAEDTSYGAKSWTNITNAAASDNADAEIRLDQWNGPSYYIKATNFGFSIPSGATIDGIVVEIEKASQGAGGDHRDSRLRIVKGGTIGSTDKADTATTWGTSDAYSSYGGVSDLWGETWTDSDINASNFGVAFSVDGFSGTNRFAYVDHIRITVYYTAGGGGGSASMLTTLGVG